MKRLIILLLAYAVGGAIINVAVAWGCVLVFPKYFDPLGLKDSKDEACIAMLRRSFPEATPLYTEFGISDAQFGWTSFVAEMRIRQDGEVFPNSPPPGILGVDEIRAGLPIHSLAGRWEWDDMGGPRRTIGHFHLPEWMMFGKQRNLFSGSVPFHPLWPGFAINTIFYAAILWLLFAAPGFVRRRIRARRGQCPACAYPVGSSTVCTECGKAVTPRA